MAQLNISTAGPRSGQAYKRRHQVYYDQHNRTWGAEVDVKTGDPASPLEPEGWTAPLVPPQRYLLFNQPRYGFLLIDYESWLQDLKAAHELYHQQRQQYALAQAELAGLSGPALLAAMEHPSPEVLRLMGVAPLALEPVVAAQKGHPWILGEAGARAPAWAHLVPVPAGSPLGERLVDPEFLVALRAEMAGPDDPDPEPEPEDERAPITVTYGPARKAGRKGR